MIERGDRLTSAGEMDSMNTHLPADLEEFVLAKVRSGRFSSADEAIAAGVRLLRQQKEGHVVKGIRQGLEAMHGRHCSKVKTQDLTPFCLKTFSRRQPTLPQSVPMRLLDRCAHFRSLPAWRIFARVL
jgi:putative addiction module CopG family antidote